MKMLFKSVCLILCFSLCGFYCEHSEFLIKSGQRKFSKKEKKAPIKNVRNIGPDYFPHNISYLRLFALIPVLPEGAVQNLKELTNLNLQETGIIAVAPNAFENLPALSHLNLEENSIKQIKNGVFNLLNIKVLHLNKNEIEFIDNGAFDAMPKLEIIKLNMNRISSWNSDWFKNTPMLMEVLIRRNLIEKLPEDSFKNLIRHEDNNKVDMKLFFSKNLIQEIHPNAFRGLKQINSIYLDRNKITKLPENMLSSIEKIQTLYLIRNNISEISEDVFSASMQEVSVLNLSANPKFRCLPLKAARKVKKLILEKNLKLNCTCINNVKKYTIIARNSVC